MANLGRIIGAGLAGGLAGGAKGYQTEAERQAEERAANARALLAAQAPTNKQRDFEWFQGLPEDQKKAAAPMVMPAKTAASLYGLPSGKGGKKKASAGTKTSGAANWWD